MGLPQAKNFPRVLVSTLLEICERSPRCAGAPQRYYQRHGRSDEDNVKLIRLALHRLHHRPRAQVVVRALVVVQAVRSARDLATSRQRRCGRIRCGLAVMPREFRLLPIFS